MLNPERRRAIRKEVYPFSEATPVNVNDIEEIVDAVQVKTAEAQVSETRKEIQQILDDWDKFADEEGGEEKWQAKYGCDTTELVSVIERALEVEK